MQKFEKASSLLEKEAWVERSQVDEGSMRSEPLQSGPEGTEAAVGVRCG